MSAGSDFMFQEPEKSGVEAYWEADRGGSRRFSAAESAARNAGNLCRTRVFARPVEEDVIFPSYPLAQMAAAG
jgi:hypothetical protein